MSHAEVFSGEEKESPRRAPAERVIIIVLDGVRWQDFFDLPEERLRPDDGKPQPFQYYGEILSEKGVTFGNQSLGSTAQMTLSGFFSRRKSLPSYQAILSGFAQPCPDNDCPRISVETLPQSLARRLALPAEKVAVISSWPGLSRAAASNPDGIHLDAGEKRIHENGTESMVTRRDERTAQVALEHLQQYSPVFLFVVFDAADHAAHEGDLALYIEELRQLDGIIVEFFQTLSEMKTQERERTTVIVTTDHGRGSWGPLWKFHDVIYNAQDIFIAATGPNTIRQPVVTPKSRTIYHADLRPTVEVLLGLEPTECDHPTCGQAIQELIAVQP
jgi:hypothetical protein